MYTIYGLIDPRTHEIRYVGLTSNHPEVRLQQHMKKPTGERGTWITELLQHGLKPLTVVLDYSSDLDAALVKESWWIKHGLLVGWNLSNETGTKGRRHKYIPTNILPETEPESEKQERHEKPPRSISVFEPRPPAGPTEIQRQVAEYLKTNPGAGVRSMARYLGISSSYACDLRKHYMLTELRQDGTP